MIEKLLNNIKETKAAYDTALAATIEAKHSFSETKTNYDVEASELLKKDIRYTSLKELRNSAEKAAKTAQRNYHDWRIFVSGEEEWDDIVNEHPETEEILAPFVSKLFSIVEEANELLSKMEKEVRKPFDQLITEASVKVEKATQAKREAWHAYEQALADLKNSKELYVPGEIIDKISTVLKEKVDKDYEQDEIFSIDSKNRDITINGYFCITEKEYIDFDDLVDEENADQYFDLDGEAEVLQNKIWETLEKEFPDFEFEIEISDVEDVSFEGETSYRSEYYESDTGYCEPAGDYYDGYVTAYGNVTVHITVKRKGE